MESNSVELMLKNKRDQMTQKVIRICFIILM